MYLTPTGPEHGMTEKKKLGTAHKKCLADVWDLENLCHYLEQARFTI